MIDRQQVCCFTGHRQIRMPEGEVRHRLQEVIHLLIDKGVFYYGSGGALGFDTIAAEEIIEARKKDPRIKLILVLPCKNQDIKWLPKDKATYSYLKTQADRVRYTSEEYTEGCMLKRNRHLVDNSGYCIALLERMRGGTYYTFNYAKSKGLHIYNLADSDYITPIQFDIDP